jgi:hypothetical protein
MFGDEKVAKRVAVVLWDGHAFEVAVGAKLARPDFGELAARGPDAAEESRVS